MSGTRCTVSFVDENGIEHCAEVVATSVFEAGALALKAFSADPFIHEKPTPGTALKISVMAPLTTHELKIATLHKWAERPFRNPADTTHRQRIRQLLGMPASTRAL